MTSQWYYSSGGMHFSAKTDDSPSERAKRTFHTFAEGVNYRRIDDPPAQIMKWTNIQTGKAYSSFDEYWISKYGHKFEVSKP